MDIIVKLNEQTVGRDKIIRLLQYGSRAYWYYAQNLRSTRQSADILRSLEYTFSSFRKCIFFIFYFMEGLGHLQQVCLVPVLRLGRCLDSLYSALKLMKYPDVTIRITLTLAKIANALFLLADHIIWLGRVGIFRVNIEKWNKVANKYWLMTIVMNLVRDVYEIMKILAQHGKNALSRRTNISSRCTSTKQYETLFCLKDHKDVVMDAIKNGLDLFIPLTALGFTKFHPGATGIFGLISSAIGIYVLIHPLYKLTP